MANTLGAMAKKVMAADPILEGREKMDTQDVVRIYGKKGFTVKEISRRDITDRKTGEAKHYYYVAIKEDDTVIITTGQVFTDFLDRIVSEVGSVEEFNAIANYPDEDFVLYPEIVKGKSGNKYMKVTAAE